MKLKTDTLLLGGLLAATLALTSCGDSSTPSAAGGGDQKAAAGAETAALPPGELIEITPKYPKEMFIGTPVPTGDIPNLEKPDPAAVEARKTFKVPKGTENVALNKPVTSSDPAPFIGSLDLVTDGDADGADGCFVELSPETQWVQIDLGASHDVWKILLWHFHKQASVYFDVVVQVSDDADFKTGVTTIFNNDHDDSSKLGKGSDPAYVETNHGRLIEGKGTKGRYVRLYSKGNSADDMNRYIEVQVYATPSK